MNSDPVIGAVLINKPITYQKLFECAAWYETHEAVCGVYPVQLKRHHLSPHHLYVGAEVAAKVTDDYFPSLWGGVAVGNKPYKAKHIGEDRIIHHSSNFVEAIRVTGQTPSSPVCWFIDPSWWPVALEEAEKDLKEAYERLPEFWAEYQKGEDKFISKVGMIGHFGEILNKKARDIQEIKRQIGYQADPYFQSLRVKNTEWTSSVTIQKR